MRKQGYLETEVVDGFVQYFGRLLRSEAEINFPYAFDARSGIPSSYSFDRVGICRTLEDLFDRYYWSSVDYHGNAAEMKGIREALRSALSSNPLSIESVNKAVGRVMDWGLMPNAATANKNWAKLQRHRLPFVLDAGITALQSEDPDFSVFGPGYPVASLTSYSGRVRMNAGYTKVYAFLCDSIIIYDSRVGAALCWLVRQFLLSVGHQGPVPEELAFLWGKGATSQNRDPSGDGFVFKKLKNDGDAAWAKANVQASWILEAARVSSGAQWCDGEEGLRKIEAALFMLGYGLPSDATKEPKTKGAAVAPKPAEKLPPNHIEFEYSRGSFDVDELEAWVRKIGRGYVLVGGRNGAFSEGEAPETLEYWLRLRSTRKTTRQATTTVVRRIVETGRFRLEKRLWPTGERESQALVLSNDARWLPLEA